MVSDYSGAKIRISEGNVKFICALPSGSIFGAAKVRISRGQCQIYSSIAGREYLRHNQSTNKPRARANFGCILPRRSIRTVGNRGIETLIFSLRFLASAIRVNSIALGLTKWFVRRRFVWHRTKKCAAFRFSFPARSVAALFGGERRAFRTVPDIRRRSRCRRTPLREACRSARLRGRRACNAASVLRDNREPPVASRIRIRRESGE